MRYLVDNSVLQRMPQPEMLAAITGRSSYGVQFCSCSATMDEACYSARSEAEMLALRQRYLSDFKYLSLSPLVDDEVLAIRKALFAVGHGRAAGVVDVQIAAMAVVNSVTVLHYDSDFEHIARVRPTLDQEWAIPRGTID